MQTKPTSEHAWLQRLVGTWTYTSTCDAGPGQEPMVSKGTEVIRSIGELWVVGENTGTMPDGNAMTALLTIGFDPAKNRFVGTWIGSPMAFMFVYEGQLEADGRTLTLNCTGPSFTDPTKTAAYQDIVEMVNENTHIMRSQYQTPEGAWVPFMKAEFRRVK